MSRRTSIGWTERETLMRRDLDTLHEELKASRAKVLEWTDLAVRERARSGRLREALQEIEKATRVSEEAHQIAWRALKEDS